LKSFDVYLHKNDYKQDSKPLLKTIFSKIFPHITSFVNSLSYLPSALEGNK